MTTYKPTRRGLYSVRQQNRAHKYTVGSLYVSVAVTAAGFGHETDITFTQLNLRPLGLLRTTQLKCLCSAEGSFVDGDSILSHAM